MDWYWGCLLILAAIWVGLHTTGWFLTYWLGGPPRYPWSWRVYLGADAYRKWLEDTGRW